MDRPGHVKIKEEKKSIQNNPELAEVPWRDFLKQNLQTPGGRTRLVALQTIKWAIRHLEQLHEETMHYTLTLPLQRQTILTGEAMERVLRYESAAERHLARAIDRLERLQRQRRGELVPPPLNVSFARRS